jgi:hypothetical protein
MTPAEQARLKVLEERSERMEALLLELKAKLESSHPERIRVRKPRRFDPTQAIQAAEAAEAHTFGQGMTTAAGIAIVALLIWAGVEVYERVNVGTVVVEIDGKPILP